jgi:hypothetical protein
MRGERRRERGLELEKSHCNGKAIFKSKFVAFGSVKDLPAVSIAVMAAAESLVCSSATTFILTMSSSLGRIARTAKYTEEKKR